MRFFIYCTFYIYVTRREKEKEAVRFIPLKKIVTETRVRGVVGGSDQRP